MGLMEECTLKRSNSILTDLAIAAGDTKTIKISKPKTYVAAKPQTKSDGKINRIGKLSLSDILNECGYMDIVMNILQCSNAIREEKKKEKKNENLGEKGRGRNPK